MRTATRRLRTVAGQILIGVLAILLVTVALGGVAYVKLSSRSLDQQYQQRAVGIANTVAQMPDILEALTQRDPHGAIQTIAERVRLNTGAAYVVVTDRLGVRYSHPNVKLIGQRLEEPVAALDGRAHVGIDHGSLGRSANGKAPIKDANGNVVGQVSVGILETQVAAGQHREMLLIGLFSLLVLGLGGFASWLLARRIKRVTFGLEIDEISSLLQEREAMLHGIREGVIGFDAKERVSVINVEAQRLLGVGPSVVGQPVTSLAPPGRLRDLLGGAVTGTDQAALTEEFLLVVNRMPVVLAGRHVGSVVTLRDRTELEALMRELTAIHGLTDALRAQEHEYTNRLHVVSGLLELGEPDEATRYLAQISHDSLAPAGELRSRIEPPVLAALLLAKITIAAENDITLVVSPQSRLDEPAIDPQALITIVGNLIDNAIDAVIGLPAPREVTVELSQDADGLSIIVSDTGPGVTPSHIERIFIDGYSTKTSSRGIRRGLGLALVSRIVRRAGGNIDVQPGHGARFRVWLPTRPDAARSAHEPSTLAARR
jgi:two-component system, CitB family, sensor kinase